ncbi:probable CCR4-NOT transcription complex subunit 3 at N-terminal half [Coccomyxa sp. Obi]|nr:probable CCR4-NOT transcription complex subunit 3 at N-terminal half [Coccomyxa sp. Obi]
MAEALDRLADITAVLDRSRTAALNRKLVKEIEQALKKIYDGIHNFKELGVKMEAAEDAKDRDKWMQEMKRELKRLQRLRDQIRQWAADPTIRDTSLLIDARHAIEHEMEHFKECEKEAKLKPFAKAALAAGYTEKVDPSLEAKAEAQRWLKTAVSGLAEQVEQLEADLEARETEERAVKKGKPKPTEKEQNLSDLIVNNNWHIARLEQILRLLENDQVSPDDIDQAMRDNLEHYMDCAADPDFAEARHIHLMLPELIEESKLIYSAIPLPEGDSTIGRIARHERSKAFQDDSANDTELQEDDTVEVSGPLLAKTDKAAGKNALNKKSKPEGLKNAQKNRGGRHAVPDSAAATALPHQKVLKATPIQGAAKRMLAAAAALSSDHTLERESSRETLNQQPPHPPSVPGAEGQEPGPKAVSKTFLPETESANISRHGSQATLLSDADSVGDYSWAANHQSQSSLGYPPGLFSPSRSDETPSTSKLSTPQYTISSTHNLYSLDVDDDACSQYRPWHHATEDAGLRSAVHAPEHPSAGVRVADGRLGGLPSPGTASLSGPSAHSTFQTTNAASMAPQTAYPIMPPGLALPRNSPLPQAHGANLGAVSSAPWLAGKLHDQNNEGAQQFYLPVSTLPAPVNYQSLFPTSIMTNGSGYAGNEQSQQFLEGHRSERAKQAANELLAELQNEEMDREMCLQSKTAGQQAARRALVTPFAQRRVDQRQSTPQEELTPQTFRTALESPLSSKQSTQSMLDFRSAQSDIQQGSPPDTSAQRSYSFPLWTPGAARENLQSRLDELAHKEDFGHSEAETEEQLHYGFSDSLDADESASECFSLVDTPGQHDGLQRAFSFASLQTVDEEEEPDGSPFKEPRTRSAKPATPQAKAAGRLNGGTRGKVEGRRKRGGRGRSHGSKLHQITDSSGSPVTPPRSQRLSRPVAPLKLADVIIPALKAKAKKQGLAFATSPDKNAEGKHADDARERPRPLAEPITKPVQPCAVCSNRSFAEVTRAIAAEEKVSVPAVGTAKEQGITTQETEWDAGTDTSHPLTQQQQQLQQSQTYTAWQQSIKTQMQAMAQSPTVVPDGHLDGPPVQHAKQTQELLTAEEIKALMGNQNRHGSAQVATRESADSVKVRVKTAEEAVSESLEVNGAGRASSGLLPRFIDFSKDPIIDMHKNNKRLGPVTCPSKGLAGKASGLGEPRVSVPREGQVGMAESKPTWQIKADWEPFSTSYPAWLSSDTNAQAVACSTAVQVLEAESEGQPNGSAAFGGSIDNAAPQEEGECFWRQAPNVKSRQALQQLDASYHFVPPPCYQNYVAAKAVQRLRSEGLPYSIRQLPEAVTPIPAAFSRPSLPDKPYQAPACFDEPAFFYQMAMRAAIQGASPDLLFFVFYFQPGTTQQAFAAAALQTQQWHYHATLKRWFHQSTPPDMDGQARSHNNDQRRYLYLDQDLRKTGPYQDWDGWCIRQTAGNFTLTGQDAGILV